MQGGEEHPGDARLSGRGQQGPVGPHGVQVRDEGEQDEHGQDRAAPVGLPSPQRRQGQAEEHHTEAQRAVAVGGLGQQLDGQPRRRDADHREHRGDEHVDPRHVVVGVPAAEQPRAEHHEQRDREEQAPDVDRAQAEQLGKAGVGPDPVDDVEPADEVADGLGGGHPREHEDHRQPGEQTEHGGPEGAQRRTRPDREDDDGQREGHRGRRLRDERDAGADADEHPSPDRTPPLQAGHAPRGEQQADEGERAVAEDPHLEEEDDLRRRGRGRRADGEREASRVADDERGGLDEAPGGHRTDEEVAHEPEEPDVVAAQGQQRVDQEREEVDLAGRHRRLGKAHEAQHVALVDGVQPAPRGAEEQHEDRRGHDRDEDEREGGRRPATVRPGRLSHGAGAPWSRRTPASARGCTTRAGRRCSRPASR
ncbi:hypothetical protein G7075_10315 [Phycicoccus sp. HDW14]|uniref:hypothetical protein n=1 Tax=Phycicoccus sp. HDW14 TaxID=2714941 RepID=UPI00140CAC1B|nr:hypothetical protein [Phycicoccus sp. HDW14]QIM21426.1 hypothetical protein G7075_10315 [Phycicoccus sp. HDW14]